MLFLQDLLIRNPEKYWKILAELLKKEKEDKEESDKTRDTGC